jgi:hypothetical protein
MRLRAALGIVLVALVLGSPGRAEAAAPCWKAVLNDRYDGQLDRTYPPRCYSEALDHVPPDVDAYTAASDDIRRALLAALDPPPAGANSSARTVARTRQTRQTETGGVAGARATLGSPRGPSTPAALDGASLASREPLVVVGVPALVVAAAAGARLLARRRLRAQVDDAKAALGG